MKTLLIFWVFKSRGDVKSCVQMFGQLVLSPPPTVCRGHHGTEVHLAGHRLPGALLTDGRPGHPPLARAGLVAPQEAFRDPAFPRPRLRRRGPDLRPLRRPPLACVSMNFPLEHSLNQSPASRRVPLFLLAPHPDRSSGNWVSGRVQIIISDYSVECDIRRRLPLATALWVRGRRGGVLPLLEHESLILWIITC